MELFQSLDLRVKEIGIERSHGIDFEWEFSHNLCCPKVKRISQRHPLWVSVEIVRGCTYVKFGVLVCPNSDRGWDYFTSSIHVSLLSLASHPSYPGDLESITGPGQKPSNTKRVKSLTGHIFFVAFKFITHDFKISNYKPVFERSKKYKRAVRYFVRNYTDIAIVL